MLAWRLLGLSLYGGPHVARLVRLCDPQPHKNDRKGLNFVCSPLTSADFGDGLYCVVGREVVDA